MGAVLGPPGAIGGAALGLASALLPGVAHLFTGDAEAKVAQVVQAATGTADAAAQAIAVASNPQIEADLRTQLAQIAADEQDARDQAQLDALKTVFADVANARQRDIQIRQGGGRNARADVMLAFTVVGIIAGLTIAIIGRLDGNSAIFGLISGLVGLLSKCFADAFSFEFGDSRNSREQTALIANMKPDGT